MSEFGAEQVSEMTTESSMQLLSNVADEIQQQHQQAESVNILGDIGGENSQEHGAQLNSYKRAFFTIFELSDDELNKIEEHVRHKIVHNGENFLQQHDTLRGNYEKFKIEYEQRFVELEADFNESQSKLGAELKNAQLFRIKANENGDYF